MAITNGQRFTLADDLIAFNDNPEPHTPHDLVAGTVVSFPRWIRVKDDPWGAVVIVACETGDHYRAYTTAVERALGVGFSR